MQSIINNLPQNENDNSFVFSAYSFKDIPNQDLVFDHLVIKTGTHSYYNAEDKLNIDFSSIIWTLQFSAEKPTYEKLAINLLQFLFTEKEEKYVKIQLTNPKSKITTLVIILNPNENPFYKEIKKPISFEYYANPESLKRSPFQEKEDHVLPKFHLTFSDQLINRNGDYTDGDIGVIELNNESLINLANFWLNISRAQTSLDEFQLESPIFGFGGVSKYSSCEATFWLSGSIGFEY